MKVRYKIIIALLSLSFLVVFESGCSLKNKAENLYFVFDGNKLKLNHEEILIDNIDGAYESFSFSNKGNIIFYNGYNDEEIKDFYLYNITDKIVTRLNVWQYFDESILREINDENEYLSPEHIVYIEDKGLLYFSANTPDHMHYRIFRILLEVGEIDYSPELCGTMGTFAINQGGVVLYSREANGSVNLYTYDFESDTEALYINNAQNILSSVDGKYLYYDTDEAYVVYDTETSKEYVLDKEKFYIEQVSFSFSGNSLISAEYKYNPWSLFSATTIDVRQIDFKTGKSRVLFTIKEDGNKAILYYDN